MTTLTMRPYAGEADLEAIASLINACEAVDRTDSGTSVAELRRSGTRAEKSDRIALLEQYGFTADRYFFTMDRCLSDPIPEPQFPQRFRLRQMGGEQDAQAWVEMCRTWINPAKKT